ncbi:MAG: winged helix-turn-helix transcriptional regulator [Thaumarchaeota archaeon]|nr:winged helix-turn-helix transcriptional regulator [Nitrososphaerota archaeon]
MSRNDYVSSTEIQKSDLSYVKNLFWLVFAASRGGQNRIRLIFALKRSPLNAHQITKELDLNYRAIQHHLNVLEKNNLISHIGQKYGTNYFLAPLLEENIKSFDELVLKLSRSKHERKGIYSK